MVPLVFSVQDGIHPACPSDLSEATVLFPPRVNAQISCPWEGQRPSVASEEPAGLPVEESFDERGTARGPFPVVLRRKTALAVDYQVSSSEIGQSFSILKSVPETQDSVPMRCPHIGDSPVRQDSRFRGDFVNKLVLLNQLKGAIRVQRE